MQTAILLRDEVRADSIRGVLFAGGKFFIRLSGHGKIINAMKAVFLPVHTKQHSCLGQLVVNIARSTIFSQCQAVLAS